MIRSWYRSRTPDGKMPGESRSSPRAGKPTVQKSLRRLRKSWWSDTSNHALVLSGVCGVESGYANFTKCGAPRMK